MNNGHWRQDLIMKALSIKQPYVDMILLGIKSLEIRSWKTEYRGRLYIHSCKRSLNNEYQNKLCGFILGYVDLIDIRKMLKGDKKSACIDYIPNSYAWIINNPIKIKPIPFSGKLGIFDLILN